MLKFFAFLSVVAAVAAQGNLNNYSGIKNALLEGSELQINADSSVCETTPMMNETLLVSMPMRQWQVIKEENNEFIRADDSFIMAGPDQEEFLIRHLVVMPDNSVTVSLTVNSDPVESVVMNCALGAGATAHRIIPGNDLEEIDSYQEAKTLLLLGDHVEAVGFLRQCRNSDEVFPNGEEYVIGYQIQRFSVYNDGQPEEFIFIDDFAVVSTDDSQVVVGTESIFLYPDETVTIVVAAFDDALQELTSFSLDCEYRQGLQFQVHERENPETYTNYAEVKDATLDGHDMEAIIFLELCEVLAGEEVDFTGQIASARFDQFHLIEASDDGLERIAYPTWGVIVTGLVFADVVTVSSDDTVTIAYLNVNPGDTATSASGVISCPLDDAALFHSVRRTRAAAQNFNEIVSDIQNQGQIFEIEINADACSGNTGLLTGTYGGIVWQSYVNPDEADGYYFGNVFALVQNDAVGTGSPVWESAGILLLPDGTVTIQVGAYDYFTGENLIGDVAAEPLVCELATGAGEGSVSFFRYP